MGLEAKQNGCPQLTQTYSAKPPRLVRKWMKWPEITQIAGWRILSSASDRRRVLEERVAAEACVFLEAVARRHVSYAVAEQPAQVAHLLLERGGRRIGIVLRVEQQRMAALRADVFVAAVAIGELLVVVLAEEARQRVPHPRDRSVFGQVIGCRTGTAGRSVPRLLEDVVVDVMAPERARQFG